MPIHLERGIYIYVEQMESGPTPRPLESGFSRGVAYRVLGVETFSETSEAYFILANDRDETWFISNRHFRVLGVLNERSELRFPLSRGMHNVPDDAWIAV